MRFLEGFARGTQQCGTITGGEGQNYRENEAKPPETPLKMIRTTCISQTFYDFSMYTREINVSTLISI